MATEAKTTNYWISNSALYIQLNATGEPNRIQASVVSGASILCYMQGIDGLGYDAGHNYQRWTLAAYPSEFPSDEKRYVYVAIPRKRTSDNDIATIVFPSQKIDIYGKAIVLKTDEDGKQEEVVGDQIGSEDYYYIYLQGIISEVYLNEANDRIRRWVQDVDFGSLSTDEALASGGVAQWWKYNSVSDTITFLKTILSATFESLVAKTISVTTLFFGKEKKITGIASDESKEDSEEVIVTPKYGNRNYLSKTKDDTAEGLITFAKGLITDAIKSLDYDNAAEQGFSIEKEKNGKYHAFVTNFTVWGKAIFHELEIRKLSYSGGNIYLSGAGSKLIKVVPVKKSVSNGLTSWVETTEDDAECVGWKCYLLADNGTTATMNYWQEGDQARCQTMGEIVSGGTYQNASNKSYWRTIPDGGVSTQNEKIYGTKTETYLDEDGNEQTKEVQVELYDGQAFAWIVVGKHCNDIDGYDDEFSVGYNGSNPAPLETRDIPAEGDTIVLDGNRHRNEYGEYDKTDRQNVIILETTGEYAPRIACYANITEYKHTITKSANGSDKEVSLSVFETSPKGGTKINSSRFEWISDDGSTINIINYRGDWSKDNTYHKNDQVNHNNAVWVCVANSGVDVSKEPSDGSSYWKKVLSGGKGEKGDDAVSYNINFVTHKDDVHNDTILYVYVVRSVGKESTSTLISNIPEISETAGLEVRVYCDGDYNENLTNHVKWRGSIQRSAWETVKNFEVRLYLDDKLVSSNSYSFGEQGEQGESALEIIATPETLVFDTGDDGLVPSGTSKQASISCYRNGVKVTNVSYSESAVKNCSASVSKSNGSATVTISEITSQEVADKSGNSSTISNTSGYVTVQVWDKDTNLYHRVQVKFMVNVAKFTGQMVNTNKRFSLQHKELVSDVKDKVDSSELRQFKGEITQTAREISLSVSEKSIARRNLLVGSAFLREDNHVEITDGVRIEMYSGYQGTNCIHSIDETDRTPHYRGAFWDGSQGGKSIKITKGKKYVLSCYYKTNNANGRIFLEALYTDEQTNAKRTGNGPTYLTQSNFVATKFNQWELFTTVIDTTNAGEKDNYLAFNFFEYSNGNFGRIDAYICRPMVEEGDTYGGWTLSQNDYDIIGANLIDNSRTLDVGGNVLEVKGQKALVGDAYELTYRGSDDYNTFYRIKGSTFQLGVDYTISFEVRGDAEYMGVYAYYPITNTKFTLYAEPQNSAMTEVTDVGKVDNYVALIQVEELSKQQRVWSHFRFKDRLPELIYFQFPKNAEQTGVTSWSVTITRPKIEVGAVVTEYTERKSDLVDKASLKAAGIEITSEKVKLYGDQIEFAQTKSGTAFAMFKDGMLDARLINAAKIIAERLETSGNTGQRVAIEDGLMQIFGTNGVCNIKFGVNDNGEAILSYYDKNGKWLYDLGPNKLDGSQITSSAVTIKEYVKATIKPGTNDFYDNVTYLGKGVKQVKFQYSQLLFGNNRFMNEDDEIKKNSSAHIGYQPFANESNVTKLYRYSAPRMGNTIVKDDKYGLSTADLAKRADGKYFTSMTMASGGSLVNLAPVGVYFGKNEAVRYAPYPNASVGSTNDRFPAFTIGGLEISKAGVGSSIGAYNGFYSYLTRKVTNFNTDIIS